MDRFTGAGGVEIAWQSWMPEGDPVGVVVIAHGVSEHSDRYAHVAKRLNEAGYAVAALDHRGHGDSGGKRCVIDRMDNAVEDVGTTIGQGPRARPRQEAHPPRPQHGRLHRPRVRAAPPRDDRQPDPLGPGVDLEAASAFERVAARVISAVAPSPASSRSTPPRSAATPRSSAPTSRTPASSTASSPPARSPSWPESSTPSPTESPPSSSPSSSSSAPATRLVPPAAGRMVHDLAAPPTSSSSSTRASTTRC